MKEGADLDAAPGAALDELLGTVAQAMTAPVLALRRGTTVGEAARELDRAGVSGAPVVDGGVVVGMVSRHDLLARAREAGGPHLQTSGPFLRYDHTLAARLPRLTVGEVMTRQVVTAGPDWPLTRAVATMDDSGVNRLPVVDPGGKVVGILARNDVIRAIALRERPRIAPD